MSTLDMRLQILERTGQRQHSMATMFLRQAPTQEEKKEIALRRANGEQLIVIRFVNAKPVPAKRRKTLDGYE